jgi:1,2-diacylglycerol 3-beta-glucosyltransferase
MSVSFILQFATLSILTIYLVQTGIFIYGVFKANAPQQDTLPPVTIVVAARNEEDNIGACLASLVGQDYPRDRFQIIIADDHSDDRTADIIQSFAATYPFVTHLPVQLSNTIKGKGNAINQAVLHATGEIILMTDADCTVQPTWALETAKYFLSDVGLVCGVTIPEPLSSDAATEKKLTPFEAMQGVDWAYLLASSAAMIALGRPISAIGNNFNFRKATYLEVGGYESVRFSVTEDFALFQAISRTKWKVIFPLNGLTINSTRPMETIPSLYKQKKRWTLGGLDGQLNLLFLLTASFLTHMLTAGAVFFASPAFAASVLAAKVLTDGLFLTITLAKLKRLRLLKNMLLYEFYSYAFVIVAPVMLLFDRRVTWKGRTY